MQLPLVVAEFRGHTAGLRPTASGRVGQHGLADVVLSPVVHGAEGDDAGVFELAEGELGR